jgi:hypothetical protein
MSQRNLKLERRLYWYCGAGGIIVSCMSLYASRTPDLRPFDELLFLMMAAFFGITGISAIIKALRMKVA